jgi:hypothetical protein
MVMYDLLKYVFASVYSSTKLVTLIALGSSARIGHF